MQQRGPPGAPGTLDLAYCNVHRRRRQRHDLVDDPEQPGQLRCTARRECRPFVPGGAPGGPMGGGFQRTDVQDDANWCTCRLHGRRRNIHHMREVGGGEYECIAPYLCHSGPNPNQNARFPAGGRADAPGGNFYQPPRYDNENHPLTRAAQPGAVQQGGYQGYGGDLNASRPWEAPQVPTAAQFGQPASWTTSYFGPGDQNREAPPPPPPLETQAADVLCARHARRVARDFGELVDDLFFVCRNPIQCLSGPLDPPNTIPRDTNILCSRHSTLRRPAFLVMSQDGQHYECRPNHQCRATDVHMVQSSTIATVGNANMHAMSDGGLVDGGVDDGGWGGGWRPTVATQAPGAPSAALFFA
jgi:hypothetical protein